MKNTEWGINGIFRQYAPKDLVRDLWIPILSGIAAAVLQSKNNDLLYANLKKLIDYAMVYLPVMATIILTAYTMMIGALNNSLDKDKTIQHIQKQALKEFGEEVRAKIEKSDTVHEIETKVITLRNSISASFAANIIITIFSLGICIGIYFILGLELTYTHSDIINYIVFAIITAMIIYPIRTMIGIVSDMFSISKIV